MPSRKSKKLQESEQEFQKNKAEKEAEFDSMIRDLIDRGLETFTKDFDKDSWVNRKLEEYKRQKPQIITGKYKDQKKTAAIFKQKFVEYIQIFCPDVIEELREFVPLFDKVFGENKTRFNLLFDRDSSELSDLNRTLNTDVYVLMTRSEPELYPHLQFRPEKLDSFRYDFKWGEYYVLLHFLYWLYTPANVEKCEERFETILKLISQNLEYQYHYSDFPQNGNEELLQLLRDKKGLQIFQEFLKNRKEPYFAYRADGVLSKFLESLKTDIEPDISSFIELKIELLNWTKRHNLDKDWLLKYAYDFISQFSINPDLKVAEIYIGNFQDRSLQAEPFHFKFEGWSAGEEDKEDYEIRLIRSFLTARGKYFHSVGLQFNLEETTKTTRPFKFDRVRWLVRWTVQGWSKDQILEQEELENDKALEMRTIESAFNQFILYNLPVRS